MGRRPLFSTPDDEFAADWAAGVSASEMARRHGYSDATGVRRRAIRLDLPARTPRPPGVLSSPEQEAAFRADWALGMRAAEMAALHGFQNVNSITRVARRLGLPKRAGGTPWERALTGGRWVRRGLVQVWVPDDEEAA